MEKKDLYFFYTLSSCINEVSLHKILPDEFKTKALLSDAYISSLCFTSNPTANTRELIFVLEDTIQNDDYFEHSKLDRDAKHIVTRCCQRINKLKERMKASGSELFQDLFNASADCLWILASAHRAKHMDRSGIITLIDDPIEEMSMIKLFLCDLMNEIEDAKKDLSDMKDARNLPIGERLLPCLIQNQSVRQYANPKNYTSIDLANRIDDCGNWITKHEHLFFMLAATSAFRTYLEN